MDTKPTSTVNEMFARWQADDEELGTQVDTLRQWMRELDQLGRQHFGETATRLRDLRSLLTQHFDREEQMLHDLAQAYSSHSPEVAAVQRRTDHDHRQLLERVDELINRLNQIDPPFDSWQQAINEIEALVSLLEQHETTEWESIESLLPQ